MLRALTKGWCTRFHGMSYHISKLNSRKKPPAGENFSGLHTLSPVPPGSNAHSQLVFCSKIATWWHSIAQWPVGGAWHMHSAVQCMQYSIAQLCVCAKDYRYSIRSSLCSSAKWPPYKDGGKAVTSERSLYKEIRELKILNA